MRANGGRWVRATLDLIARHPATRAEALAAALGLAKDAFKPRVRRLKELGLTESLEVGYRLSPRGEDALKRLR
jgi:Mn-dependent DtxR family transcriptional regulator